MTTQTTRRRWTWMALWLITGIILTFGGIVLARPIIKNGCICIRPNQIFQPLPESSMQEAIPAPHRKECCVK